MIWIAVAGLAGFVFGRWLLRRQIQQAINEALSAGTPPFVAAQREAAKQGWQ